MRRKGICEWQWVAVGGSEWQQVVQLRRAPRQTSPKSVQAQRECLDLSPKWSSSRNCARAKKKFLLHSELVLGTCTGTATHQQMPESHHLTADGVPYPEEPVLRLAHSHRPLNFSTVLNLRSGAHPPPGKQR